MNNNQLHSSQNRGATQTNPTQPYSQTRRPARRKSKAEIARRLFFAKCVIAVCMTLVLGGVVYLLCRSGLFSKSSSKKESSITSLTSVITSAVPSSEESSAAPTELPADMSGYTVILDPGHGGWDRGTSYPFNSDQNEEPTITIKIAGYLKEELESRGAKVYVTRTEDNYYSLYYRLAEVHLICMDIAKERGILPFSADREQELRSLLQKIKDVNDNSYEKGGMGFMAGTGAGPELKELFEMEYQLTNVVFISIHLNAHYTDDGQPVDHHGIEVTYVTDDAVNEYEGKPKNQTAGAPVREAYHGRPNEHNLLFCQTLYDAIIADTPALKSNMDKPVYTANWAVIRKTGLVGTLLEFGFISHETDRAILQDEAALKVVCSSVADGIEEYFKQIGVNTTA